jgi:hypothetical protein
LRTQKPTGDSENKSHKNKALELALVINKFNYNLTFIKGKENCDSYALSRLGAKKTKIADKGEMDLIMRKNI